MADIIIIAVLAIIVFFILRSQLGKLRKGQCAGGCAGCAGCGNGGSCGSQGSGGSPADAERGDSLQGKEPSGASAFPQMPQPRKVCARYVVNAAGIYADEVAKLAGVPDMVIDRAKEIVEQLTDNDIIEKIQNITVDVKDVKAKKQPPVDEMELSQMSLFDTVKDEDVLQELMDVEVNTLAPIDALNVLYRLQNKLKNRWKG